MRTNLSEELKLNDDISLDDGSEKLPELEKEKEKLDKEIQKDLDAKVDIAKEIRDAEAPKAEINDAKGKSTKIKQFVEKLILEEPSDALNEDIDTTNLNARRECLSTVYNALAKYANYLYYDLYPDLEDSGIDFDEDDFDETFDIFDELSKVCEEALIRAEDGEWV